GLVEVELAAVAGGEIQYAGTLGERDPDVLHRADASRQAHVQGAFVRPDRAQVEFGEYPAAERRHHGLLQRSDRVIHRDVLRVDRDRVVGVRGDGRHDHHAALVRAPGLLVVAVHAHALDLADVDEHEAALYRARQRHVAAGKYERARHGRAEAVAASRVAGRLDRRIGGKDPVARIQLAERLEHGAVVRSDEGNAVAMAYTLRRGLGVFGGVDVAHADDGLAGEARVATAFQAHGDTGESLPALAGVLLHPRQAGEQLDRGLERERVAERARIAEASVVGVRARDVERERAPVVRVVARADQRVPVWQRERVRSGGRHGIGAVRPARLGARSPVA